MRQQSFMARLYSATCATTTLSIALSCQTAFAACPCESQGGEAYPLSPVPMTSGLPSFQNGAAMMGAAPAMMGVQMGEVAPPPGTLGRTYQLRSRPIPTKMHPRVGMVDIRVPGATEVLVHDLNEFRTEDSLDGFQDAYDPTVWHFESEPLLPGLPHIYRVEAKFPDGQMQERYIRLIMGRLVELDF